MAAEEGENVLQRIKEFGTMFSETLSQFRECHGFLLKSGLFSRNEILEVDTCAIAFRDLGLKTTTLAKVASSQWLDAVILCYENEKDFGASDWSQMQQQLANQAKDLKKAFLVIKVWANSLSEQFHKTGINATKESREIEKRFEEACREQKGIKQAAEEKVLAAREVARKASKVYEDAEAAAKKHCSPKFWARLTGGSPQTNDKEESDHNDQSVEAHRRKVSADENLKEAMKKFEDANEKFEKAKSSEENAKILASKVHGLLTVLDTLKSTCEHVATYWMTMKTTKFEADDHLRAIVTSGENLALWRSMKSDFEAYITVMSHISNTFNFSTNAKLPPYQSLHFDSLDFELLVPANLKSNDTDN